MEWNVGVSGWKIGAIIIVIVLVIILIVYVCKVIARTNELADIENPSRKDKKGDKDKKKSHHRKEVHAENQEIKLDNIDDKHEVKARHANGCQCKRCSHR
jgi:flagellar biosynthesis/type III secretory pathway M-ring protein FliF/YscJ